MLALTRTLALEWAPTVRVNAVCPGYVLTPMQEAEYTPEMLADVNRQASPWDASHARGARRPLRLPRLRRGRLLDGQVIVMDGGETAGGLASR